MERENSAAYERVNDTKEGSLRRFRSTSRNTSEQRKNQRSLASGSAYRGSNPWGAAKDSKRFTALGLFPKW